MPIDPNETCKTTCPCIESKTMCRFEPYDMIDHSLGGKTITYSGWWCLVKLCEVSPDRPRPCGVTQHQVDRYAVLLKQRLDSIQASVE